MYRLILFFLLGTLNWPANTASWKLVNAIAASIEGKPFSVQDAYIYRALERALSGKKPVILIEKGKIFEKTVQKAVLQRVLLEEAKEISFRGTKKPHQVNDKALKEIMDTFESNKAELMKKMADIQLVDQFFQIKVTSLTPLITDLDVQQYMQVNKNRLEKVNITDPKLIKKMLQREKKEKAVQDYVDFLTTKYKVILFDL